jgi:hypothetical protein
MSWQHAPFVVAALYAVPAVVRGYARILRELRARRHAP